MCGNLFYLLVPTSCKANGTFTGKSTLMTLGNGYMDWTCYRFNWTASSINHTINFNFREACPKCVFLDDVSILDNSANQLISNGGFEGGTYGM